MIIDSDWPALPAPLRRLGRRYAFFDSWLSVSPIWHGLLGLGFVYRRSLRRTARGTREDIVPRFGFHACSAWFHPFHPIGLVDMVKLIRPVCGGRL